ncbi:transaldolase family protein [Streptomyces sp. S1D4-11]|nr:transaldolase family protein [Streptomyces sp. S1D4-11]
MSNNDLETPSVDTIRTLCTDAIQAANSGHPGTLLAYDTQRTVAAARALHARADRRNLFIKIPGRPEEPAAIEEAIASGAPVNMTLPFSADHNRAAADVYLRGVERRVQAGHHPAVGSVASVFMSRWDVAVKDTAPAGLTDTLAFALAVYRAYPEVMGSQRFQRLENAGTRMRRLLWAGTRTKHPAASDTLYVRCLAAPFRSTRCPMGTAENVAPHRVMEGNRPTNVLPAEVLTPYRLGTLVALYEHSVFTPGDDLGDRLLRPVGRRARQGACCRDHPGARERDRP